MPMMHPRRGRRQDDLYDLIEPHNRITLCQWIRRRLRRPDE